MTSKNLPAICFFGCGNIAERHSKILKKLYPEIKIYYASRNKTKGHEFCSRLGGVQHFSSYESAAASDKYQIAFITTPHSSHLDLVRMLAPAKKNIILEKPLARNEREAKEIIKLVTKYKVRCGVAENYFFKKSIIKIKEYINSDFIGTPLYIELNKINHDKINGWRSNAELMGGGALLEGGCHWVNALVAIADSSPESVLAVKSSRIYPTTVPFEDTILVNVKFANGIVGKLFHSWRIPNRAKGLTLSKIYGTDGVITFESNGLFIIVNGKKRKRFLNLSSDFLGYKAMHEHFIESYINNQPWQPELKKISHELSLICKAYQSLKSGKFEKI